MAYTRTTWLDRSVEFPTYYLEAEIGAGVYSHTPAPGVVTEAGTTVTATRMNNIEQGITDNMAITSIYAYKNIGGSL